MFTHLPGTHIACAKSLGRAALVVMCTGHLGKPVTSHVRAHVWEGPTFESSQHKRSWAVPRSDWASAWPRQCSDPRCFISQTVRCGVGRASEWPRRPHWEEDSPNPALIQQPDSGSVRGRARPPVSGHGGLQDGLCTKTDILERQVHTPIYSFARAQWW